MRKYAEIREVIRGKIVEGDFSPGTSIPTWDKLQNRFNVSRSTVRLALRDLKNEGFIRSGGRNGTLVVDNPPHLVRYALVLPHQRGRHREDYSIFWHALEAKVDSIVTQHQDGDGEVEVFRGVEEDEDSKEGFLTDIESHQYAGLIFARDRCLLHHPRVEKSGVPRVFIGSYPDPQGVPAVYPDTHLFMKKALNRMASVGCQRVAILTIPSYREYFGNCLDLIEERELVTRPGWVHTMSPLHPEGARSWVRLLMSLPEGQRPDGLIVTDDNLVAWATAGLFQSGVDCPEDCYAIVEANYPCPPQSMVPVDYLGCDAGAILKAALEGIDGVRNGHSVPEVAHVEPYFRDASEAGHLPGAAGVQVAELMHQGAVGREIGKMNGS